MKGGGGAGGINGEGRRRLDTAPVGDGCTGISLVAASRQALRLCQPCATGAHGADDIRTSNVND